MTLQFDIDLGIHMLKGALTLHDEHIVIDWRRYDIFEAPITPLQSMSVQFADLSAISVQRKIRRPTLEITALSATTFGPMPLPAGSLTTLRARVARADKDQAEAWGAEASLRIAEAMTGGSEK